MNYTDEEKEFQAEMTAYAVSSYFGIDTSEYSIGYLASWTKGRELKDKVQLLKEVHETCTEFIETIESTLEKEKEQLYENEVEDMSSGKENKRDVEIQKPLVTLETLGTLNYLEVARLHVMDNETKNIYSLPILNKDKRNRDDLRFSLTNQEGRTEEYHLHELLKQGLYEEVQKSIFQNKENESFVIHEANIEMNFNTFERDVRYGAWLEKDEKQKIPSYSEKEVGLYKEMRKEGYAPIDSLEQEIQPSSHTAKHVTASMEKELSEKYEAFKRAQYHETVNDIDSIITRVKAEERYFATKTVSIDNELITQEAVTTLENRVREKLGREGIKTTNHVTSKTVDMGKQFEPLTDFPQRQNASIEKVLDQEKQNYDKQSQKETKQEKEPEGQNKFSQLFHQFKNVKKKEQPKEAELERS